MRTFSFSMFPFRQKMAFAIVVIFGGAILVCSGYHLLQPDLLNTLIGIYGLSIPLCLLSSNALIDFHRNAIFLMWLFVGVVLFAISLKTKGDEQFIIHQHKLSFSTSGVGTSSYFEDRSYYATGPLKALLCFLIAYWFLNKLFYRKGQFMVNTFRQSDWYHDLASRKITFPDVLCNIILLAIIFGASLYDFSFLSGTL